VVFNVKNELDPEKIENYVVQIACGEVKALFPL
jgi:hypothetical protein